MTELWKIPSANGGSPFRRTRLSWWPRMRHCLGMIIQNVGPAVFEVTVENGESVVLMTGKMTVMHAYGKITIENFDDYPGIAEIEFMPRSKKS